MTESNGNGVRITNQAIYDLVLELKGDVKSVKQTMNEVVLPEQTTTRMRLDRLEMRVYAITAGLLAAAGIGKGIGLL